MKIQFLSTNDIVGGAARATNWLARGLREIGEDVDLCVQEKQSDFYWVSKVKKRFAGNALDYYRSRLDLVPLRLYQRKGHSTWSLNILPNEKLYKSVKMQKPDIVNLHWVGGGFLPISQLRKYEKPIVWSLYDIWPFSGGCHYANTCQRFSVGCGFCPQLGSKRRDITSLIHKEKLKQWANIPIVVVAPSKWLADEARKSKIFSDKRIEVIPHGTDLNVFKPIDKSFCREVLNLPLKKKLILFGAHGIENDPRKGFQFLLPALSLLKSNLQCKDVELILMGSSMPRFVPDYGFPIHYIGKITDEISLAIIYSAADLTVTPSMQEAFGMTASESMACGTPVVAFNSTGPIDVIDHGVNGYLANMGDIQDLAKGLLWIITHENYGRIAEQAREKCKEKFELKCIASQYKLLYEELISFRGPN